MYNFQYFRRIFQYKSFQIYVEVVSFLNKYEGDFMILVNML